jgi:hypothetical protein
MLEGRAGLQISVSLEGEDIYLYNLLRCVLYFGLSGSQTVIKASSAIGGSGEFNVLYAIN